MTEARRGGARRGRGAGARGRFRAVLRLSRFDLAARAGACAFAVLALAGCPPRHDARAPAGAGNGFTGCLPLTGTSRAALRLGPGGSHLYWTEQVRLHGYEDAWPSTEVVRWTSPAARSSG